MCVFAGLFVFVMVLVIASVGGSSWRCLPERTRFVNNLIFGSNATLLLILTPLFVWMSCLLRKYPADGRSGSVTYEEKCDKCV